MLASRDFCGTVGRPAALIVEIPLNPELRAGAPYRLRLSANPRKPGTTKDLASVRALAAAEPIVTGMVGRYATALFDLAREANTIDAVKSDLERFDGLVAQSPDLARLVRSPVFSAREQIQALAAVLDRAGIRGLAAKFLKLVASNRRLFAVRDMVKAFRELVAEFEGKATAEVVVAEPLGDKHVVALRDALKMVSGKDIDLDIKIDPAIIGGLVVKLGSRMVDTSLRTKLEAIRQAMKEAR